MNQFSNKKLIVLLVSVIVFVALLAVSLTPQSNVPIVQQIGNDVAGAAGRIFTKPANAVSSLFESVNGLLDTYEENQHLKKKIDELSETQIKMKALEQENEKMLAELDLQHTLMDYKKITGAVIARNPDNWVDQLVIDKGSQNGLEKNMSVMSDSGLIGRVSEVEPTSAKIQLLTTINQKTSQVSAEVMTEEGKAAFGVISSYDDEKDRLVMTQITTEAKITVGEKVVTSGLGGVTPRSLLIGTVEEVAHDRFGLSQEVYIKPSADFLNIKYVTVIMRTAERSE